MYGTCEQFRAYLNSEYPKLMSFQTYLRMKIWPLAGPVITK